MKNKLLGKDLLDIIKDNQDLPVVFFVPQDDCEYNWTLFEQGDIAVGDIIYSNTLETPVFDDKDDAIDFLSDYHADDDEAINMSDEEYNEYIEERFNEEFTSYKAIIMRCWS